MPTALLKQRLNASTSMLAAERRRLETEILNLETRMATQDNTDDLVRRLKVEVDAGEQRLAEQRELLAKAEQQRGVLARDRAAAQEAAHQQAVASIKARLGALLDRKIQLVEHAERLARELLDTRKEITSANTEMLAEAERLGAPRIGPLTSDVIKRLSLREAKLMAQLSGCRHQFGYMTLPSGSFGLVPDALTWAEDEERSHRDLRALVEQEG